ncbi:MAG: Maf family protein [Thermaerobacter sp.]|nr:septum formation inhibitor Maf [Bacillota bacterium]REJ34476.1 MAG: septum formation inhibitor Maf [Bacillota bacterium]
MTLLLASSSPRRRELLAQIGLDFTVVPSGVDEDDLMRRLQAAGPVPPEALVTSLAAAKAREVASRPSTPPGALVLAADTVVVLDGDVLGKPADEAHARQMLGRLAGRVHRVMSGVAVARARHGLLLADVEVTAVRMAPMDPETIARYVATGEPLDKAGSYAVQGLGSVLVERIEGCYFNVVGLPLARTVRLLERFGLRVADFWYAGNPAVRAT